MSEQSRSVFRHCVGLAKELEAADRLEEEEAVLRALSVYLDALPAIADGSCRHVVEGMLSKLSPRVRVRTGQLPRSIG